MSDNEIGILTTLFDWDSGLIRSILPKDKNYVFFDSLDDLLNSNISKKIIVIDLLENNKRHIDAFSIDDFPTEHVNAIVFVSSEMDGQIYKFMIKNDHPKVTFFVNGFLNKKMRYSRVFPFLDWFATTIDLYKNKKPSLLDDLTPHEPKPFMFDVLLGVKKPHRDLAWNTIRDADLTNKCIVRYFGTQFLDLNLANNDQFSWEDKDHITLPENMPITQTVQRVKFHGHEIHLSQILPRSIYNKTAYSLVCETSFDNRYVFLSEKTVKPILSRRLFITLGDRYTLARLRDLGFKTFDGIIDESYDEELIQRVRWQKALSEMLKLCQMNQSEVLAACHDIVDHNARLLLETDWMNDIFLNKFYDVIAV